MPQSELVIAHHLPDMFAGELDAGLPAGVRAVRLSRDNPWDIPAEVEALFALPRAAGVVYPEEPPPGWPFNLRWVQTASTGIDGYAPWVFDVDQATCARGSQAVPIAEFIIASILAVEKAFPGLWITSVKDWHFGHPVGVVAGKTIGFVGFGTIGQAAAKRALAFDARVIATTRTGKPRVEDGVEFLPLDDVLAQSDHLVIAAPLTPELHGLIRAETIARMKPGAHIVNIARGGHINQDDLIAALDSGHLKFASLDVTDPEPLPDGHPLYAHPKIHVSPHFSWGNGQKPLDPVLAIVNENVRRFQQGQTLLNPIDREAGY